MAIKALSVLTLVGFTIGGFGQACSSNLLNPGLSLKASSGGNGGGYGGMLPRAVGAYQPDLTPSTGSEPNNGEFVPEFFLFGTQSNCSNFPAEWADVGSRITGILSFSSTGSMSYSPSFCATPELADHSALSLLPFAKHLAVFQDDIYVRMDQRPLTLQDVREPVALCRDSQELDGNVVGISIYVFRLSGKTVVSISEGSKVGEDFIRFDTGPFPPSITESSVGLQLTADYFDLVIAHNGSKVTSGEFLGGEAKSPRRVSCWLAQP